MNNQRKRLRSIVRDYSEDKLQQFFRNACSIYKPTREDIAREVEPDLEFINSIHKLGEIEFDDTRRMVVVASSLKGEITERTSKKKQFDIGWKYLKKHFYDAGIFVYYDDRGHFRFSLIVTKYSGNRRTHTPFRRYTYYIHPEKPNKTFLNQIGKAEFSSIDAILKTFSIEAVSNDFYNAFNPKFREIAEAVQGTDDVNIKEDFALLFVIRIIFIGFVQKRGWLGDKEEFIKEFLDEYKAQSGDFERNQFYKRWLSPLFFEALNSPPGRKVKYQNNDFSSETEAILQMAPYLNGELFKERKGYDDQGFWIPDKQITEFIEFLFQYNFTIEENTYYDEELELNPEFLGIIFERLVNKEDGAVYTPRTEVDFMCRMALVKWLEKNNTTDIDKEDLYHLFFRDRGQDPEFDEHQKQGDFTTAQIGELVELMENVTVCDPAAGSGAFEVGMLHVLHDVLENLFDRHNAPDDLPVWDDFERKKMIIARSLYGVEVKHWAVWINHLRLWLTLFIDMPDDYKTSLEPLLPSLNFKVRVGDSLVQRIGSKLFPVQGHAHVSPSVKRKITELKKAKTDFFYNRGGSYEELLGMENRIFREILDEEIAQKHNELKGLTDPREEQGDLGFGVQEERKQYQLEIEEKEKEHLRDEISELQKQKKLLREQHPLVWNIEFAEIFFDRGGFDVIIGNPPYVRQEDISDPFGQLEPKVYKQNLNEAVRQDFDKYFTESVSISGRSDLYTFFYIRSLRLLNPKGVLVFICSNSWLDVGFGDWLQRFLLKQVPVYAIVDNHAKRSFVSADVNTVISIMEASDGRKNEMDGTVRFIAFKKPFEETIIAENLLTIEQADESLTKDGYRVFPVTKERLLEEGSEFENEQQKKMGTGVYVGDKWGGKYLRAPDIYFTILEKGEGKLVKLKEVADVRLGIKTGGNEFFYLTKEEADHHGIEREFLRPAILKTDSVQFAKLSANDIEGYFFWCDKEKDEIKGTKALEYIKWGEDHPIEIKQGKRKGEFYEGFHQVSSVQGRRRWYDISSRDAAPVWWMIAHNERSISVLNDVDAFSSNNFFELIPRDYSPEALSCYLTSTISCFYREILGRSNYGGGLLKTEKPDLIKFDVLKFEIVNGDLSSRLPILERKSESIFKECGINPESDTPISDQEPHPLPDRTELDNIVFDALGLTEEERKEVYRATCQLVWNRISKARSV